MARCCSASSSSLRRWISSACSSRSLAMRSSCSLRSVTSLALSTASRAAMPARSASCSRPARSLARSARWRARAISTSRSCIRRACSASRSMSRASFSASRFLVRIEIIVSCSISLRCFLRRSICSVSRVRPSASNALLGLKNSMPVWSSWVSEAASSSRPFFSRSSATDPRTRRTYSPRFSCRSSMVVSAATVRRASTNLPSSSSRSFSGSSVRVPRVCAASATACALACTRT